ncbi:MAG: sulfotransferase [Aestuariivirga sp.]|uniref:tetratricopeptide repeat-containing sulfotransferase family protein n=1 Tax=Aestuariivirga sp. TaxID=2650926 RepID=UPI0025C518DE|nr:sulfotransferase [Aestuariivirga sp.]MCA3560662.1 sulfotransferase [Aestuariivirga sp.]
MSNALRHIDGLLARGSISEAEAQARQLVRENPLSAQAQFILGIAIQSQGRFEQAEPHFARAVTLDGKNVNYILNYGLCLLSMGRVPEAAALYGKARSVAPSNVDAIWRSGSFLARIGHMEEALAAFSKALERAPEGAKHAIRLEVLDCLLSLGRVDEARAQIERFIATTPHHARYLCLLASIGKHDAESDMFGRVGRELARPDLPPVDRSDLMVRRGVMLQQSKRYDEAFASFTEAKRLLRAPSVTAAFAREVDARVAAFDQERLGRLAAKYGRSGYQPVFVVGLPRSGTTLAAQIISAHSRAGNAGELETMTYCAARLGQGRPLSGIEASLEQLGDDGVAEIAEIYEGAMRYVAPEKALAVDKMPLNFRFIGEAAILFPRARFVNCTRHPADTFISALQTEMNAAHSYSYDPAGYAAYHREYRRLMAHWDEVLPGRVFHLSYERLVSDPEPAIAALLDYLGLPMEEACLHPERNAGAVTTFSRLQVRSGINTSSVARWKPYERHLKPILESR